MVTKRLLIIEQERLREGLLKYTRQAFYQLPPLETPQILDIGCGSGIPTLELARLSQGRITGIDINLEALNQLKQKAEEQKLSDRIQTIRRSLQDMDFPEGSFDVIWAEGSIGVIGFQQGLQEWRRFLKPGGFLVVHDEAINLERKCEQITACGYELVNHFIVSDEVWWQEYYAPLEAYLNKLSPSDIQDSKLQEELERARQEIEGYKKDPQRYRSVFFILRKIN